MPIKEDYPNENFSVRIKAFYKSELAELYGISSRHLRDMINRYPELKEKIGNEKLLTPKQVRLIFEFLGEPGY